jgi:hypothetical protein
VSEEEYNSVPKSKSLFDLRLRDEARRGQKRSEGSDKELERGFLPIYGHECSGRVAIIKDSNNTKLKDIKKVCSIYGISNLVTLTSTEKSEIKNNSRQLHKVYKDGKGSNVHFQLAEVL